MTLKLLCCSQISPPALKLCEFLKIEAGNMFVPETPCWVSRRGGVPYTRARPEQCQRTLAPPPCPHLEHSGGEGKWAGEKACHPSTPLQPAPLEPAPLVASGLHSTLQPLQYFTHGSPVAELLSGPVRFQQPGLTLQPENGTASLRTRFLQTVCRCFSSLFCHQNHQPWQTRCLMCPRHPGQPWGAPAV